MKPKTAIVFAHLIPMCILTFIRSALVYLFLILAFVGAIFGFCYGGYLVFHWVFGVSFDNFANLIHGNVNSKAATERFIMYLIILYGSKLLIPIGAVLGGVVGWTTFFTIAVWIEGENS